jgi:uncharacterized protein (DUF1800 family)
LVTSYSDVAHLLRRAGFGGTANEISALAQLPLAGVVDAVISRASEPSVTPPSVMLDVNAPWYDRWVAFVDWWFERMRTTPSPLAEKMVLFWHGHFTSSVDKTDFANMWDQLVVFRNRGMGSFRDLAQAVAITPAMLEYLDNESNVKSAPNENFARELMELFTLGVNQYTQADVTASAKAWTGHGLTSDKRTYVFTSAKHDTTNKTFFGITKNWDGPEIIDEITLGSKKLVCARFIAEKLWTFFAYPRPESAVSDALTSAFANSNLDITTLLRAMFLRPEFYSTRARQEHVRNPIEYLVAMMRYTGLDVSKVHPDWYLSPLGQYPLRPPNVAGWGTGRYWVSSSTSWARSNLARNTMWNARSAGVLSNTNSLSIQTAVQRAFDTFGIDQPSASTRNAMETAVYNERYAKSNNESQNLLQLVMLCPEFQVG